MFATLKQFITHDGETISHTKFWANIAYLAGTIKFIMLESPTSDIWMIYLGVVGGAAIASKFIEKKFTGESK